MYTMTGVTTLEYLMVKCRPFYLPREFTAVIVTAVYIPPDANASIAQGYLLHAINSQQNTYLEAVHVIAGDFNHADLKAVLPKFHQHIKCATRGKNTLDKAYSNIKNGYRTTSLPSLGTVRPHIHTPNPSIHPPKKESPPHH